MAYSDHFTSADDFIAHLDGMMGAIGDPLIEQRYLGFIALSAVTVFEIAIKDVLTQFSDKKHPVLGNFARSKLEKINGRIKLKDLESEFIKPFGDKYLSRFKKKLDALELATLTAGQGSIKSSYGNVIQWRHVFVHQGIPPQTTNYAELKASYQRAKHVIHCLHETMKR